ncbi:MAG: acetylglutamate kinase [Bacteroidetes bacterium]|nr:acetylglutamate kinase [Bacteroidota bacterium]
MKTAVIKLSGKSIEQLLTNPNWINQIRVFLGEYDGLVIVHGAGNIISDWSLKLGCKSEFINGHRVTNDDMMDVVAAVQNGLINAKIVAYLLSKGINAAGYNGVDNGLFEAEYISSELGYVGIPKIKSSTEWLKNLMLNKTIPVFSSICRDKDGHLMNVNADVFTIALADAIQTDAVIFLSDIDGVKIYGKTQMMISENDIHTGINNGEITDGMIPKLQSCIDLIKQGVSKIWIGNDLHQLNPLTKSKGTWVVSSKKLSA